MTADPGGAVRAHYSPAVSRPIPLRRDLRNHSPSGFAWGYEGSGPAQLALAILAFHAGDRIALEHYQAFEREIIAACPQDEPLRIAAGAVDRWLWGRERRSRARAKKDRAGEDGSRRRSPSEAQMTLRRHYRNRPDSAVQGDAYPIIGEGASSPSTRPGGLR